MHPLFPVQDYFELGVILLRKKLYTQVGHGGLLASWGAGCRSRLLPRRVGNSSLCKPTERHDVPGAGRSCIMGAATCATRPCAQHSCLDPSSPQATKNLEKAQKGWTGEPEELAQVRTGAAPWG